MMGKILTKRRAIIWVILFVSLVFLNKSAYPEEKEKFKPKFSIKLTGGWAYMNGGDFNRYLKDYDNYLSEMTDYEGGEIKTLQYGSDLEGELRWNVNSKFAVSVGVGYMSEKNKSYFEYTGPFPFQALFEGKQNYFIKPKVKTIPLKLGIHYTLPLSSRINLFLNGGLGYYFSKASLYKCHWSSNYGGYLVIHTKEENYDISSNGLGFHGGIGFEYDIANNLALVLEFQGRYARIKNLKGNRFYNLTFGVNPGVEEEGILYIGERDLTVEGYGENCPDLIISQSKPSGDEFQNIKRAVLDLSGFSFRAGIRIRLF